MPARPRGRAHLDRGSAAERLVVEHLVASGWQIVATNLRLGKLEIDVVARKGPLVAVVEVRTRGTGAWLRGLGSVDAAKRRRIRQAGERLWQRRYKNDASVERMRFDVASVTWKAGVASVEYVQAAF